MKKIKEASQLAGVSKRTLQYYDEEGILVTGRDAGNHRIYDPPALEQIWQILIYKGGKTYVERIREIREGIRRELMKEANGK